MSGPSKQVVHRSSAIPFRRSEGVIEFCLVVSPEDGTWNFPTGTLLPGDCERNCALEQARSQAALEVQLHRETPLGEFEVSRGDTAQRTTAYLVRVLQEDGQESKTHRRRWCLAEEAKSRIRRKPMRRLIDVAVRELARGA